MNKTDNGVGVISEEINGTDSYVAHEPKSRMQKRKKAGIAKIVGIGVLSTVVVLGIAYVARAQTFNTKFFPNTYINGIDASYKTPDEIEQIIRDEIANYSLRIKSRGNEDEIFKGADVGLRYVSDNSVVDILEDQNILNWFAHTKEVATFDVPTTAALDEDRFKTAVLSLSALDSSNFVAPENARISEYDADAGYTIIPEVQGNTVDIQRTEEIIRESMLTLKEEINLDTPDANVYATPTVFETDANLRAMTAQLNRLTNVNISYPSKGITLDGNTIHSWLSVGEDGQVHLDEDQVREFVKSTIAPNYDTAYKPKKLRATGGTVVTIKGGDYGWKVNQAAEATAVLDLILAGESTSREPEFSQKAASLGENDYGNSYVEVNLATQKLYLYKDGNMILSSDFVSGNVARGWTTPGGAYSVTYTQRNATLNGEDYSTPVDYWMPFNRGIGFHDAPWRGAFGGQIYRTNGSHGCINLPPAVAKTLFSHIGKGFPVLCHYGGGVAETTPQTPPAQAEQTPTVAETVAPGETAAPSTAAETTEAKAAETTAAESKAEETLAPQTQGSEQALSPEEGVKFEGPGGN